MLFSMDLFMDLHDLIDFGKERKKCMNKNFHFSKKSQENKNKRKMMIGDN